MKKQTVWILTADHQHARMFATDNRGATLIQLDGFTQDDHLPVSHEAGSHRPDIGFASRGGPSHGYPPRTTPHEQAGLAFVDGVVAAIAAAGDRQAFDRLILIAPPRALGELRDRLPDAVRQRVAGELNLDLTKAPVDVVEAHVRPLLHA